MKNVFDLTPGEQIQIEATILDVKRVGTSVNGNPQFMIQTSEGAWTTKPDSMIAYGAESWAPFRSENVYCDVTLTLRKARKYVYVVNIEGPNRMDLRYPEVARHTKRQGTA